MSRQITLQPRLQLQDISDETGSYPTVCRTGDIDRFGKTITAFNDANSLAFVSSTVIDLPTGLPANSRFLGSNSRLVVSGSVVKGLADDLIFNGQASEGITPFNEARFIEQFHTGVDFYETGSKVSDVGLGFTSPLRSKTVIDVDLSPALNYELLWDGTNASSRIYPMAYYNFVKKQWEGVGLGDSVSTLTAQRVIDTLPLAIGPSTSQPIDDVNIAASLRGLPMLSFGFPVHAKFHATSSQLYPLSGVLNQPFVLEKLIYEFSSSFDLPKGSVSNFMILNQRGPLFFTSSIGVSSNSTSAVYTLTMSLPTTLQISSGASPVTVSDIRDIVTFCPVGMQDSSVVLQSDIIIPNPSAVALPQYTGSLVLTSSIKSPAVNRLGIVKLPGDIFIADNPFGARNGIGTLSGRDLTTGLSGLTMTGTVNVTDGTAISIIPNAKPYSVDPYILLPTDNLIFAWHLGYDYSVTNRTAIQLSTGKGRLRLYGSLIRENKEYHDTINQALTSNSVHEMIIGDIVVDQFDTEYKELYSGSSYGIYVTGAMSTGPSSRKVLASSVSDCAVTSSYALPFFDNTVTSRHKIPGFLRGVQCISDSERIYDTLMPMIDKIITTNGSHTNYSTTLKYTYFIIGDNPTFSWADVTWNRAFPFEPKYSAIPRVLDASKLLEAVFDGAGSSIDPVYGQAVLCRTDVIAGALACTFSDNQTVVRIPPPPRDLLINFFGVGALSSGSAEPANIYSGQNAIVGSVCRGFKYGIYNAVAEFSKAIYRKGRYGQLRDQLEQRIDTKFYDVSTISSVNSISRSSTLPGPVQIKFVEPRSAIITLPVRTVSSNLSIEATSSLPYFDGYVKNREDPIDTTNTNMNVKVF